MLNEKRVKHMVKLSFYETKGGSEEIRISRLSKRAYVVLQVLWSVTWMTVAYVLTVVLISMAAMNGIVLHLSTRDRLVILVFLGASYLGLLIFYIVKARKYYKAKHKRAHHRVKQFKEDLSELERMYDKEEYGNGQDL